MRLNIPGKALDAILGGVLPSRPGWRVCLCVLTGLLYIARRGLVCFLRIRLASLLHPLLNPPVEPPLLDGFFPFPHDRTPAVLY